MGRFYKGDIEGKFWFAVQDSDDASFFGGATSTPVYINFEFTKEDLPKIISGVKICRERLGDNKKKLDAFFRKHDLYNDGMLVMAGFIDHPTLLEWYARLELGEKILKCVKKKGYCFFEAEC